MNVILTILVFACPILGQSVEEIDYYENLVTQQMEEAVNYKLKTNNSEYMPDSSEIEDIEDYDFVIIGAGTAGSVVASRLSEMAQYKILLLEAGTYENNFTRIPGMSFMVWNSEYNWGYKSVPQTNCCQATMTKTANIHKGRGFGGTTIFNGLRYVRGNKLDFDYWVKMGNHGWSYKEVLPYFKKAENTNISNAEKGYHGYSGPIHVEYYKPTMPHVQMILNANKELGFKDLDYNGKEQLGASRSQLMSKNGRRMGTGAGYIDPIRKRPNIKLMDSAFVTQILIDSKKTAYGVLFSKNKKIMRVKARREIILSAGSVSSPQILMLSGIGPAKDLTKLGIKVIQDLQVGKNVIDHSAFEGIWFNTNSTVDLKSVREYVTEYLNGYGAYTIATGIHALGFHKTKYAAPSDGADIALDFIPPYPIITSSKETSAYTPENYDALTANVNGHNSVHIGAILLHPRSRGTLKLKSKSPYDYPEIDINVLSDKDNRDVSVIYEGIQLILKLGETEAFKKLNASLAKIVLPACKNFTYLSKEFWECNVRQLGVGGYHIMSTCPMGPRPSTGAVVNFDLKVHGIKHLRVVDTSVIIRTSGYPTAVAMMIGEKISDKIKKEHASNYHKMPYGIDFGMFV